MNDYICDDCKMAEHFIKKGRADREEEIFKFLEENYTSCTNDGDYYDIAEVREQLKEHKSLKEMLEDIEKWNKEQKNGK